MVMNNIITVIEAVIEMKELKAERP